MRGRILAWAVVTALVATPALAQSRVTPDGSGGGAMPIGEHAPHLTDEQRREIQAAIDANIQMLEAEGRLERRQTFPVRLIWPLAAAYDFADPGYAGISGYVDHDPNIGVLQDWNCGTRTYDRSNGYNHQGTDYFTWPFGWYKMDNDEVDVVAAADGIIVYKQDGQYDRRCGFNSGLWNAVYVCHGDGSVAWYGHLKSGSVTSKIVGDQVVAGEPLGVVGSSGSSTAPHLHLELYDRFGALLDPYAGPCNTLNDESLWVDQEAYRVPQLNRLQTGPAAAEFPPCPTQELPNTQNVFDIGDTIYFTSFYRDQMQGQIATHRIRRPDATLHAQ